MPLPGAAEVAGQRGARRPARGRGLGRLARDGELAPGRQPGAEGDGARARGARHRRQPPCGRATSSPFSTTATHAPVASRRRRRCAPPRRRRRRPRPTGNGPGRCCRRGGHAARLRGGRGARQIDTGAGGAGARRPAGSAGDARRNDPARPVRRRRRRSPRRSRRHGRDRASRSPCCTTLAPCGSKPISSERCAGGLGLGAPVSVRLGEPPVEMTAHLEEIATVADPTEPHPVGQGRPARAHRPATRHVRDAALRLRDPHGIAGAGAGGAPRRSTGERAGPGRRQAAPAQRADRQDVRRAGRGAVRPASPARRCWSASNAKANEHARARHAPPAPISPSAASPPRSSRSSSPRSSRSSSSSPRCFAGAIALLVTPREEEPQIVVPFADVFVQIPGASAEEVENLVATPLENRLWEIDGVEYVYSMSRPGEAVVTVRFFVGEDRERSLVKMCNKILSNQDAVPPGVTGWIVKPVEIDDVPILLFTLSSPERARRRTPSCGASPTRCSTSSAASPTPGSAGWSAASRRRVTVYVDPAALAARGVSLLEVVRALGAANMNVQAGRFARDNREVELEAGRSSARVDEVGATLVASVQRAGRCICATWPRWSTARRSRELHPHRFRPAASEARLIGEAAAAARAGRGAPGGHHRLRQTQGHQRGARRRGADAKVEGLRGRHPGRRGRAGHAQLRRDRQREGRRAGQRADHRGRHHRRVAGLDPGAARGVHRRASPCR